MTTHPWQNRIVGHADVDPLTLKAHPKNFRTHANQQRRLMEAALDELGHVGEIVVNRNSRRILNGHLRVELAIGRAEEAVPVTWLDVSDEEELVILAFFDSIGEQAKIDADRLRANFQAITAQHDNLRTVMADWAASFQVTILPAKPTQAPVPAVVPTVVAPPPPAAPAGVVAAQSATVPAEEIVAASAPVAAAPVAEVAPAVVETVARPAAVVAAPEVAPVAPPVAAPVVEVAPVPAGVEADLIHATVAASAPAVEQPVEELALDEMALEGDENPFADMLPQDMFAAALAEDHRLVAAQPTAIAEVVEEVIRGSKGKKKKAEPAAPPRTHALIKIGEYDQEIELSVFTPWFNALVAHAHGDGYTLMQLIKGKLGIVT